MFATDPVNLVSAIVQTKKFSKNQISTAGAPRNAGEEMHRVQRFVLKDESASQKEAIDQRWRRSAFKD